MSRAALLRATCLSGLAFAASAPHARAWTYDDPGGQHILAGNITTDEIVVGNTGYNISLSITDWPDIAPGDVTSNLSIIGSSATADNNIATVTESWITKGTFTLGKEGSDNRLNIQAGGKVTAFDSYIGYAEGSTGNIATVTGANSVWNAGANLHVGYEGASNELKILDGGKVSSSTSWVGNEATADKNIVTVTGKDSSWETTGNFTLGKSGDENQLNVSAGATVEANWFIIGRTGDDNKLNIQSGGKVTTKGTNSYIGEYEGSTGNIATVTGANSEWIAGANLYVGNQGASNELKILDGGKVSSSTSLVGNEATADKNIVTVSGAGSKWTTSADLIIGTRGSNNSLLIEAGGEASARNGNLGYYTGADDNEAIITGKDSKFSIDELLTIGTSSDENTLTLSEGAQVSSDEGYIGLLHRLSNILSVKLNRRLEGCDPVSC